LRLAFIYALNYIDAERMDKGCIFGYYNNLTARTKPLGRSLSISGCLLYKEQPANGRMGENIPVPQQRAKFHHTPRAEQSTDDLMPFAGYKVLLLPPLLTIG